MNRINGFKLSAVIVASAFVLSTLPATLFSQDPHLDAFWKAKYEQEKRRDDGKKKNDDGDDDQGTGGSGGGSVWELSGLTGEHRIDSFRSLECSSGQSINSISELYGQICSLFSGAMILVPQQNGLPQLNAVRNFSGGEIYGDKSNGHWEKGWKPGLVQTGDIWVPDTGLKGAPSGMPTPDPGKVGDKAPAPEGEDVHRQPGAHVGGPGQVPIPPVQDPLPGGGIVDEPGSVPQTPKGWRPGIPGEILSPEGERTPDSDRPRGITMHISPKAVEDGAKVIIFGVTLTGTAALAVKFMQALGTMAVNRIPVFMIMPESGMPGDPSRDGAFLDKSKMEKDNAFDGRSDFDLACSRLDDSNLLACEIVDGENG